MLSMNTLKNSIMSSVNIISERMIYWTLSLSNLYLNRGIQIQLKKKKKKKCLMNCAYECSMGNLTEAPVMVKNTVNKIKVIYYHDMNKE